MKLRGFVFSGLGKGAHYVEKYNKYFLEDLGMEFFPGTLNLRVNREVFLNKNGVVINPKEKDIFEIPLIWQGKVGF